MSSHRRLFASEVVQSSAMDCGPATLKCLLEGFGIPVSYGRLREACQTDVDGTSIDTMEEVARRLGLEAEQIMLPADHLCLVEMRALPAVCVVRRPNGLTHFLVVWRQHGPLLQLMDPAIGRRWITPRRFHEEVYVHTQMVPWAQWRDWAESDAFREALHRRLKALKVPAAAARCLWEAAVKQAGWRPLGALDAAIRMVNALVRAGALRPGVTAARVVEALFAQASRSRHGARPPAIPPAYWSVESAAPAGDGAEQVAVHGLVLVRVLGRRGACRGTHTRPVEGPSEPAVSPGPLSPELAAALAEPRNRPGCDLWRLLRADGLFTPLALSVALGIAAAGLVLEALLFRGLLDIGRELNLTTQRLAAIGGLCLFGLGLLLLELPLAGGLLRMGRHLETRLRIAFLEKIPRLADRYFQSRLVSDMAERSHMVHWVRLLPYLGGSLLRSVFELALTVAGIIWLDPRSAPLALAATATAAGIPLLLSPRLKERELRVRTHVGALNRFYLDALLGLVAVRAHGAERAVRSEHESLLADWVRAGLGLQRTVVLAEGLQSLTGFGLAAWLLFAHLERGGEAGAVLLLIYWALNLPLLGQEIGSLVRQYPVQRNVTLRLLEPLGAPETPVDAEVPRVPAAPAGATERPAPAPAAFAMADTNRSPAGVRLALEDVSVCASGHTILQDIRLQIEPGNHVAIVGRSGAGKSSLVGLLLGWHRATTGRVLVDDEPLAGPRLEQLRRQTAWVDPGVQLWHRSLVENLRYGSPPGAELPFGWALEQADLLELLEKLPEGLQTQLGEGGGLLSGSEAQRVRFGRGVLRPGVRLAILDEPFCGLDRDKRRALLARARRLWSGVTLLCVTHDIGETQAFDRVLVLEGGRIVADGPPATLAGQADSRYAALLAAETAVRETLWSAPHWRRLVLAGGQLLAHRNNSPC